LPKETHIYLDNYFVSPELLLELKECGHDATCTVLFYPPILGYSKKRKEHIDVEYPALIKAYNKSMGE
jgi:hypothetical protein